MHSARDVAIMQIKLLYRLTVHFLDNMIKDQVGTSQHVFWHTTWKLFLKRASIDSQKDLRVHCAACEYL